MKNDGGSCPDQYGIPEGTKELQDLIEYRGMNFAVGNIFKACYRMGNCDHSDSFRDAKKILWFAQREVDRISEHPTKVRKVAEGRSCDTCANRGIKCMTDDGGECKGYEHWEKIV